MSVHVTIADDGPAFNPVAYPTPKTTPMPSTARGAGLGTHLMRTNAAGMTYRREDGRNILTLTFTD